MGSQPEDDLRREIEGLLKRLERIESALGLPPELEEPTEPPESPPAPIPPPIPTIRPPDEPLVAEPPITTTPQPTAAAPHEPAPPISAEESELEVVAPLVARDDLKTPPPHDAESVFELEATADLPPAPVFKQRRPMPPITPVPPSSSSKPGESGSLELLLGQRGLALAGAITVLIGVGSLLVMAVQQGWWGALAPVVRCLLIAGFGGLLIVGGEIVLRKVGRAAAVGLFGAGLGTLYLDAFATFEWFSPPLLQREGAFVMMALVALLGFGITIRTKFLTIGILSVLGGYITPWLLRGSSQHTLEVGAYLTMLLGISLALSMWAPRHYRTLRYVTTSVHGVLGIGWVLNATSTVSWMTALAFMAVWWGGVFFEVLFAALRRQSWRGNIIVQLLATAWFVTLGCWVIADARTAGQFDWLGVFTLVASLGCAAVALQFGPGIDGLRRRPHNAMEKLAISLWVQAAMLLIIAVALRFDDYGQSISWLAIGLASIEIGRRIRSRALEIFGLIVGALAVIRVATLDWWISNTMSNELLTIGDIVITNWTILALAAMAAVFAAAHRLRASPEDGLVHGPIVLTGLGVLGWMCLCVVHADGLTVTGGWLVACVVLLALHHIGRAQRYFEYALLILLACVGKWLILDAFANRFVSGWSPTTTLPLANWQMALAVAMALIAWLAYRVILTREKDEPRPRDRPALGIGIELLLILGSLFMLIALSFQVDHLVERAAAQGGLFTTSIAHVRQLALTMLWSVGAIGVGMLARWTRSADSHADGDGFTGAMNPLAGLAWFILAVTAAKWIVGDSLYFTVIEGSARTIELAPVLNMQIGSGMLLVVGAVALYFLTGLGKIIRARQRPDPAGRADSPAALLANWIPVAIGLLILWGLTFEVDRMLLRHEAAQAADWTSLWPAPIWRALWWTALWGLGGSVLVVIGRFRRWVITIAAGWSIVVFAAMTWLGYETLGQRIMHGVTLAPVVFNLQFAVGVALIVLLALTTRLWQRAQLHQLGEVAILPLEQCRGFAMVLIGLIGLWLGSLEIDRFFAPEAEQLDGDLAVMRQAGLSVYWGLYAVGLITIGFIRRSPAVRYAGLALLGITLVKAVLLDMKQVADIVRVASFVVLGLLAIGTSVAYARLAQVLGSRPREDDDVDNGDHDPGAS